MALTKPFIMSTSLDCDLSSHQFSLLSSLALCYRPFEEYFQPLRSKFSICLRVMTYIWRTYPWSISS